MKLYIVGRRGYEECTHDYLSLDHARAMTKLIQLNIKWCEIHNPSHRITDKDGNNTGPYEIYEEELDVLADQYDDELNALA